MPPDVTLDEYVSTIQHSELPVVIVEGSRDMSALRCLETILLAEDKATILPVGGRPNLLALYERRSEFNSAIVAFLADRDLYLFAGIPSGLEDIVWSSGYCLENDIYSDGDIERLFDLTEAAEHRMLLDLICRWFAFEVEEHLAGRPCKLRNHVNEVVEPGATQLSESFVARRGYRNPSAEMHGSIRTNYKTHLRGKQLFQLALRLLAANRRTAKYSLPILIELCIKSDRTDFLSSLLDAIRNRLGQPS